MARAVNTPGKGDMLKQEHIGGDFDDFLREEGILESAQAVAAKRIIAFQIAQEMERRQLTKLEMARLMKTSRPTINGMAD